MRYLENFLNTLELAVLYACRRPLLTDSIEDMQKITVQGIVEGMQYTIDQSQAIELFFTSSGEEMSKNIVNRQC